MARPRSPLSPPSRPPFCLLTPKSQGSHLGWSLRGWWGREEIGWNSADLCLPGDQRQRPSPPASQNGALQLRRLWPLWEFTALNSRSPSQFPLVLTCSWKGAAMKQKPEDLGSHDPQPKSVLSCITCVATGQGKQQFPGPIRATQRS